MTSPAQPTKPDAGVNFGYRRLTVRATGVSFRVPLRLAVVSVTLYILAAVLDLVAVRFGDFPLTLRQVVDVLTGGGNAFHRQMILEWRLPVAVAALLFGTLLGVGGAIFQSLTRNPLGSPDVIGFDAGAFTAVTITALIIGHTASVSLAIASLIGGLGTALIVYLLAIQQGRVHGFRLIIVGIAVAAMLGAINAYLIARAASVTDAIAVGFWSAGSLSRVNWSTVLVSGVVGLVVLVVAAILAPNLRRLELGDDAAITLGMSAQRSRLALVIVGVATTALVTAAAGPISFVALAAPQLARRLTRTPGVSLLAAGAMGSALLSLAHLVSLLLAQHMKAVPVGLVTVCIGGLYLIALLVREARRHYGVAR